MKGLGITRLFVSNASGAINLNFKKGEIMLIDDHINLQGGSPLAFKGVEKLGERFVDLNQPYDVNNERQNRRNCRQAQHKSAQGCIRKCCRTSTRNKSRI